MKWDLGSPIWPADDLTYSYVKPKKATTAYKNTQMLMASIASLF